MSNKRCAIGVVNGRFQPLHHGHMEYIFEAKKLCQKLIVGITNPDTDSFAVSKANPHRSTSEGNPFTYYERMEMIRDTLIDSGLDFSTFDVVPFPINSPKLIHCYVPKKATIFFTVYDSWGADKIGRLKHNGFATKTLWERSPDAKITTGSEIRNRIAHDKEWGHLVPSAVYRYITERELTNRWKS